MSWPFYLAFKHLFPTGRGVSARGLRQSMAWAVGIATVLLLVLLGFLWWRGALAQLREPMLGTHIPTDSEIIMGFGLVWLWMAALAFIVVFVFKSTPFFNAMSIFGITLGVTVLITVQSVMNGFADKYESVFIETQGNLIVHAQGPMDNPAEIANIIKAVPGVKLAEPVSFGVVMLLCGDRYTPAQVRSIDVDSPDASRDPLAGRLLYGKFADLDDHGVLLGTGVAALLGSTVGGNVDVYSFYMAESIKRDNVLMPKELNVVGEFNTGFAPYDENTIAVTRRAFQDLYGYQNAAGEIEVRLDNDEIGHTYDVKGAIEHALKDINERREKTGGLQAHLEVETWQERNRDQLEILFVEKSVMFYIMVVIVVVAAFCILCSLATSVVRKTREIGVLGALGAQPQQVAAVFCLQAFIIGVAGALLGVALSFVLLYYRQNIVEAFVDPRLLVEYYNFYQFPVDYHAADFVKIIGFTFFISTLAGLIPALWAARLKPADCLRYE